MSDTLTLRDRISLGLSVKDHFGVSPKAVRSLIEWPIYATRRYTIDGEDRSLKEWCEHYGTPFERVRERLRRGLPILSALTLPSRLRVKKPDQTGGYQPTSPKTKGTGLGSVVVERGHSALSTETKNPAKAGE